MAIKAHQADQLRSVTGNDSRVVNTLDILIVYHYIRQSLLNLGNTGSITYKQAF